MSRRRRINEAFGTGAGPTSAPIGDRGPVTAQQAPPPVLRGRPARYVLLFGPRGAGVTTAGLTLAQPEVIPTMTFVDRIHEEPAAALVDRVHEAESRLLGRDPPSPYEETQHTVLIGGRPFSVDDLQALHDAGIARPGTVIIRLDAPWATSDGEFNNRIGFVEQRIGELGLRPQYFMVWTGDARRSAASIALRAGYR